jgi:hypothetical protein
MNLGILNTVIAMVIVFLVLSLIVQSVQMFVKKILKLKSRQILGSLEDLYEQAIETSVAAPAPTPPKGQKSPAKEFTDRVVGEFTKIGRVTSFGNPVLDSLSKEDLFKIMAKLESENFVPDYVQRFQELCDELNGLRKAIETLAANNVVKGVASAKLAEIRTVLAPVFNDVKSIVDQGSKVRTRVLFGDLLRLGKLRPSGVLELLNESQQAITSEIEVASKTDPGSVAGLQQLSNELSKIARLIGDLSQKFDDAFAPLRGKLEQVETWYDTVMQSFDERYARSMKTVALCISIVVVIVLNANFFNVYSSLSTNEVKRNLVLDSGQKVLDAAKKANLSPTPTPSPRLTPAATSPTGLAGQKSTPEATPSPSPSPTPEDIKKVVDDTKQDIDVYLSTYQEFGFSPLTKNDVHSWFESVAGRTLLRSEKGVPICQDTNADGTAIDIHTDPNCTRAWRDQSSAEWWASRRNDVFVLFGWTIMVLLLSVGAPFWQDTLESLFGIKNLLRQRSGTQNIEQQSGAGQPKG